MLGSDHARRPLPQPTRAVLFDMDGTLTRPILDFGQIKAAMGCPQDQPILEWLAHQPPADRARLEGILVAHEVEAAKRAVAAAGAHDLVDWLADKDYKLGIITRNCREAVAITLERCTLDIRALWTREDIPRKPSGLAVAGLCRRLDVRPEESVVVGDYRFDLQAAREAGAGAVLLLHESTPPDWADLADVVIRELAELKGLL